MVAKARALPASLAHCSKIVFFFVSSDSSLSNASLGSPALIAITSRVCMAAALTIWFGVEPFEIEVGIEPTEPALP